MDTFILEEGAITCVCWTPIAFLIRVSMSATGSVCMMAVPFLSYQLDLVTPGTLPSKANSRKHMRHSPKRRMYARGRPHFEQRFRT